MSQRARFASALGVVLVLASARASEARPTLWQRAKDPHAVSEAALARSLERMLDDAERAGLLDDGLGRDFARAAVAMIELSGIRDPRDPWLAYLQALAFHDAEVGRNADVLRLLESALARLPEGSRATRAGELYGTVLARLGRYERARTAFTRVIDTGISKTRVSTALAYRGSVRARLGELEPARRDYESAMALAPEPALVAYARYGLALVEERLGDRQAALAACEKATRLKLPVPPYPSEDPLDLPEAAFFPAFEEDYVRGLRAIAAARSAADDGERRQAHETAELYFQSYLELSPLDEALRVPALEHLEATRRALRQSAPRRR